VRELKNVIERTMLLEQGPVIHERMLMLDSESPARAEHTRSAHRKATGDEQLTLEEVEIQALIRALERSAGNHSAAARLLGVSRDAIRYRIRKFGITLEIRGKQPEGTRELP